MARVATIFALISGSIEQKVVAECAQHELVELPLDELVTVHLVHLALALAHGALTAKTSIDRPLAHVLLDYKSGA